MDRRELFHPSDLIDPSLAEVIRNASAEAEELGMLHPAQLAVIYKQGWFNLFVPHEYGGLDRSLPEALRTEEGLAWADGSTGWTVTLCSGAAWFTGFLQPEAAAEIFKNDKACFAGSGRPSGRAKYTEGSYEITGCWNYATGAPHATVFTANCVMEKDGSVVQDEEGAPLIQSFFFLKEEVTVHENWRTIGMIATASHSFEAAELHVAANRCFRIDGSAAFLKQPVYQYPFLQFAEATLAVNSSGMAARFLELCEALLDHKMKAKNYTPETITVIRRQLNEAKSGLQQARRSFYTAVEDSWEQLITEGAIAAQILGEISITSRALAEKARKVTDQLYPYCGLTAADPGTEISRVWRNLHTASQHNLLSFPPPL